MSDSIVDVVKSRGKKIVTLVSKTYERFDELEGFRLGAAFSYYATFAIFPMILLTVTLIGYVVGDSPDVQQKIFAAIGSADKAVTDTIGQTLAAMQDQSARKTAAIVGVVSLFVSASGAFVELDFALNKIWRVAPRKGTGIKGSIKVFLAERLTGLMCVVGVGLFLVLSLIVGALINVIERHTAIPGLLLEIGSFLVSLSLLTAAVAAAFHFVPRSRPPFRDVLTGAFVTTLALTALKALFALYLSKLTSYSAYGAAGGVLALATWIYLTAQIIYFGATLTRVYCEDTGSPAARERDDVSSSGGVPRKLEPSPAE